MFYSGDAEGAIKAAQALNPQPVALIAASRADPAGSKAGLAEINKLTNSDTAFKDTARTAGEMLMNTRHYALAADFLQAGAAATTRRRRWGWRVCCGMRNGTKICNSRTLQRIW